MINNNFDIPPTLLEAMHQMYGDNIKSVTVCTEAFDGEQEIFSLEDDLTDLGVCYEMQTS